MAVDLRNTIFTKTFDGGDGNEYALILICGHHEDIASAVSVEFPDNLIFETIKAEVGYEDDIPIGLPTAKVLSLEINLANINDDDWADVSRAIVRGKSEFQRTVNDVAMFIPNVWIILPVASLGNYIYTCQLPSEKEIEIDTGVAKYTIDLIGIEKPVLERLSIDMLDLPNLTPTYTIGATLEPAPSNDLVNVGFDIGGDNKRYLCEEPIDGKKLFSMSDFFGRIEDKAQILQDAFIRGYGSRAVSINISDIDNIWTFFYQDVATNHSRGSELTFSNILIFGYLFGTDDKVKGGFFDTNAGGLNDYNNVWSFLRQFCDSMGLKATLQEDSPIQINFYPIFDTVIEDSILTDIDPISYRLKPSDKYISESTSFTVGGGGNDNVNHKSVSEYGSIDGASNDTEILFNTLTLNFSEGMKQAFDDGNDTYIGVPSTLRKKGYPSSRTLYYKNDTTGTGRDYWKVHDDCTLNVGGGTTPIQGSSIYTSIPYPTMGSDGFLWQINAQWASSLIDPIRDRQKYYGIGYNRSKAAKLIFSNENQGIFTATLSAQISASDFILLRSLGETYTIDLSAVSGVGALGEFSGKLILTNIKYDFLAGTADCTFFMRGDASA